MSHVWVAPVTSSITSVNEERFPGSALAPGKRKLRLAVTPTFARSLLIPRLRERLLGLTLLICGGCSSMWSGTSRKTERSSSVVNYLYPGENNPLPPTEVPVLRLPLRVGIAFVPSGNTRNYYQDHSITEVQKTALMERVAAEFKGRDYIQSIEIIPTSYLRPAGGFANLNQVRSLLGVDVIALVAYDQVQFTNENILSLANMIGRKKPGLKAGDKLIVEGIDKVTAGQEVKAEEMKAAGGKA